MKISARNQLKGRVVEVRRGATTAHVRLDIGNGVIVTSSITNEAVDDLGLAIGDGAVAVIKASDVMVGEMIGQASPSTSGRSGSDRLGGIARLSGTVASGGTGASAVPVIAAAADLNYALPEIVKLFTEKTGKTVKLIMGSSGNFAAQIQNGAPFDLFFSADESYVEKLAAAGLTVDDGALYAVGRIGVFAVKESRCASMQSLAGLKTALAEGRIRKFAIPIPSTRPMAAPPGPRCSTPAFGKRSNRCWFSARTPRRPRNSPLQAARRAALSRCRLRFRQKLPPSGASPCCRKPCTRHCASGWSC